MFSEPKVVFLEGDADLLSPSSTEADTVSTEPRTTIVSATSTPMTQTFAPQASQHLPKKRLPEGMSDIDTTASADASSDTQKKRRKKITGPAQ